MNAPAIAPSPARATAGIDPRSLGLGRIALGLALLLDLGRRATEMTLFYSNDGLLPNHTVLWQPMVKRLFSVFFTVSLPHEAALAFVASAICFVALAVGFRTRLFHVLSLLCFISLRNRIIFIEGEGSALLGWLCLWTLFLPLSRRFSVDAVLASLRGHDEHSPAQLDAATWPAADSTPVRSLAALAVRLQLAAALFFWCANRSGPAWADGTAAHYLLHQDRVVTALGVWTRAHASPAVIAGLTFGLRFAPLVIAVLVLLPVGRVWARRAAIVMGAGLVLVQAALINDGPWAVALLAFLPFLLTAPDWEALVARARRKNRARLVVFDGDCGICFQIVRALRRMDPLGRLRLVANDDLGALPSGLDPALLERTILVVDPASGQRWTRAQAFAETFRALPGGSPVALFIRLPLIRTLADAIYDRVAENRTRLSVWLGLAACGVPQPSATAGVVAPAVPSSPRWARARESLAAVALLVAVVDALALNPAVPPGLRGLRPDAVATLVGYTGLSQAWTQWAPEPPRTDRMVFVDAVTGDGRHLDPFNAEGSRVHKLPVTTIPARLGQSALLAAYVARIPDRQVYFQALLEWILRTPERTGHRADRIVAFDLWALDDDSPPPGETSARNPRPRLLLHHEAPPPPSPPAPAPPTP